MNYIKHLNACFDLMKTNPKTNSTLIALYVALFLLWNQNRFAPSFGINRQEMINLSKLGIFSTYSKCMKELHYWGWIVYHPSTSKYGISQVSMLSYEQFSLEQLNLEQMTQIQPTTSTPLGSSPPTTPIRQSSTTREKKTGTDSSKTTSTTPTKKQEVGHLLKQQTKKEEKTTVNTKFYEPL
ncbi:hypothetical protein ACPDHL_15780 [Myroides sp. C15-4]|uniref:hypothetical protein n=1 Tax=Myroides sp. C15-4 TaxID=3400532 RepID=UPI003D2F8387